MRLQFLYSIYWCAHSKVENMCRSKGGFYYPKLPLGYEYPTGRAVARGVRGGMRAGFRPALAGSEGTRSQRRLGRARS
jgi:hypothetical protein